MQNPFTLTFGKTPLETIERPLIFNEVIDSFSTETLGQQVYIITGIKGSGKTVIMSQVAENFKAKNDWIVVELNPETDMLLSLAAKLYSEKKLSSIIKKANINLSFFGFGIDISGEPQITDIGEAIRRMLESLKQSGKRVLITVDEVTNSKNMRVFTSEFQILVRDNLPVCLLMTGLYKNVSDLQNEKSLTFLYRAPKLYLTPLNKASIISRYKEIFKISHEDASQMAELTKGYPFAFQALGYLTWNNNNQFLPIVDTYRQYLEEYSYEKIWSELSAKDKTIAHAIATVDSPRILDIRNSLKMDPNSFNPYRKRLIRAGIVNGTEFGKLTFILPFFKEFVRDNYE